MNNPIKGYKQELYPIGDITQWFAENPLLYAQFDMKGHNGIDIVRPHGTEMYAIENGTILDVKDSPDGYGKHVRFLSKKQGVSGYFHEWTYGHCSNIFVKVGDEVKGGQLIAAMGNTGFVVSGSTPFWKNNPYAGTHLHLGLRLMKRVAGGWKYPLSSIGIDCVNYNNGYKGSIDPAPYLKGLESTTTPQTVTQLQLTVISLLNTFLNLLKSKK